MRGSERRAPVRRDEQQVARERQHEHEAHPGHRQVARAVNEAREEALARARRAPVHDRHDPDADERRREQNGANRAADEARRQVRVGGAKQRRDGEREAQTRSLPLMILRVGVSGISAMTTSRSGSLFLAISLASRYSHSSASDGSAAPGLSVTKAQAFSPSTGSGIGTIADCRILGCASSSASTSTGLNLTPPRLMMSLLRPVIAQFSARRAARSRVRNQPSSVKASRVAASFLWEPEKARGPRTCSSPS